jgi:cobalt-precorrin-5B (C1)-methyltransferase
LDEKKYVYKFGKKLRTGYTTGSCAAAAAKAAVFMLFSGQEISRMEIDTPKGWKLNLDVQKPYRDELSAGCFVIKDAGDDPDVTDGIEVHARATRIQGQDIVIRGGRGIGTVTRPGLLVPPGEPAINPVPRSMILNEVKKVLPVGAGVEIEISIPQGAEIARKTFNPKLGIIGGISLLGTTGIVEPMSEEALKDTVALELRCKRAAGDDKVVLVPGSYGERFCEKWLGISPDRFVKISNYLGFALEKCAELGFTSILLAGHLGKLVKPAAGIFYTHSRVSDTRMEILTAYLGVLGMKTEQLREIMNCQTTEEAIKLVDRTGYQELYQVIAEKCAQRCAAYVYDQLEVGVVLFSMEKMLAQSSQTEKIIGEIR